MVEPVEFADVVDNVKLAAPEISRIASDIRATVELINALPKPKWFSRRNERFERTRKELRETYLGLIRRMVDQLENATEHAHWLRWEENLEDIRDVIATPLQTISGDYEKINKDQLRKEVKTVRTKISKKIFEFYVECENTGKPSTVSVLTGAETEVVNIRDQIGALDKELGRPIFEDELRKMTEGDFHELRKQLNNLADSIHNLLRGVTMAMKKLAATDEYALVEFVNVLVEIDSL